MKKPLKDNIPQNFTKSANRTKALSEQCNNIEYVNTANANELKTIKAAAYIRVSTDEQVENGYSLQLQRERITAQITAKGWELFKIYEDGGQSGGKLERPALQEMLTDIEVGNIQAVVIYKLDRLSRKQRDTMYLIEDVFLKQNIELLSISESLDTSSPTGRAMIGMLSVFAQLERDTITERLSSGRKQKATTGGYCGGNSAIGYNTKRGKKSLFVDKNKADTVRRVFVLKDEGLKLQEIADRLNIEGHTTKQGAKFSSTQVMRILNRRRLYEGTYVYSGITADGQHAAII
ncbi:MAG: recombinase family protein [Bacteroidales bacterium]|jgi:site-specific DNA recombinase|nr:recombinase family protein [Bacteroidales bacterium]